MNVSIAPEQKRFISGLVKKGRYVTSGEVVREGLRLLQEREYVKSLRDQEIRKKLQEAVDEIERGEYLELDRDGLKAFFEKVMREGRRRMRSRRQRQ